MTTVAGFVLTLVVPLSIQSAQLLDGNQEILVNCLVTVPIECVAQSAPTGFTKMRCPQGFVYQTVEVLE